MRLMLYSSIVLLPLAAALGINCRGSGACPLAGFENDANEGVLQGLRDAIHYASESGTATYNTGDHIICVSTKIGITIGAGVAKVLSLSASTTVDFEVGGICAFGQGLQAPLTLAQIGPLADALLEHGCTVCGSVPVHFVDEGSNDPSEGILTFNYVSNDVCVGSCLGEALGAGDTTGGQNTVAVTPAADSTTAGQDTVPDTTTPATYGTAPAADSTTAGQDTIPATTTPATYGTAPAADSTTVSQDTIPATTIPATYGTVSAADSTTPAVAVTVPGTTTATTATSSSSTVAATVTVRIGSAVREAASDLATIGLLLSQLVLAIL